MRSQIGRYVLVSELGRSAIAVTYRGNDTRLDRTVALKLLSQSAQYSTEFNAYFLESVRELAQLAHPGIARIYDYGFEEGLLYVVQEYISGQSLSSRLGKPLEWRETAQILLRVLDALEYAHQHGVIHRDLKPDNILFGVEGQPVLCDFGIARMVEEEETRDTTVTNAGLGSPFYMSPEQARGLVVDFRADLYAVGVIMYEMLSGRRPFAAESSMETLIQHVSARPPSLRKQLPKLPQVVEQIVFTALAKDPDDRFQSAGEMAEALRGALQDPRPRRQPGRKPSSRSGMVAWLAIPVLFAGVLVGGLLYAGAVPCPSSLDQFCARSIATTPPEALIATILVTATPPAPTATTAPVVTHSPAPTRTASPSPVPTATQVALALPVFYGQPLPALRRDPLSLENIHEMAELARWGSPVIESLVWAPGDDYLVAATSGGIAFFDPNRADHPLVRAIAMDAWMTAVSIDENRRWIAAGGKDGIVRVWDYAEGKEAYRFAAQAAGQVNALAFSPDGALLASASEDTTLRVWDMEAGEERFQVKFGRSVTGVAFSPDAALVAAASLDFNYGVYGTEMGQKVGANNSGSPVNALAYTEDGRLVVALENASALAWKTQSETNYPVTMRQAGHVSPIRAVAVSPSGNLAATGAGDGEIRVWNLDSGKLLDDFQSGSRDGQAIVDLDYSHDGMRLASLSETGVVTVWDTQGVKTPFRSAENRLPARRVAFSPDHELLAVQLDENEVVVWSMKTGKRVAEFEGKLPDGTVFSPEGSRLAVLKDKKASLVMPEFSARIGAIIDFEFLKHETVGFLDEKTFAIANESIIRLWSANTGGKISSIANKYWSMAERRSGFEYCHLWHTNTDQFWVAASYFGIYADEKTARFLCMIPPGISIEDSAFAPGQEVLAITRHTHLVMDLVEVWTVGKNKPVYLSTGREEGGQIIAVAVSPGGNLVAGADESGWLYIWNQDSGEQPAFSRRIHAGKVNDIAFSVDGRLLATVGEDGLLEIWGLAD